MPPLQALPLYSVADIRAIERQVFARRQSYAVMQQAGEEVARVAATMLNSGATVLALAGGGNNGGDACIAAAALRAKGYKVRVQLLVAAEALPPDAKQALVAWQGGGGEVLDATVILPVADLYIDGIFGIGLSREVEGAARRVIEKLNAAAKPVLSIDTPSGLCADTGVVRGAAVRAQKTLTFFGGKPGLFTADGRDYSGDVVVADLGEIAIVPASGHLLPPPLLPPRRHNSHKGDYGTVLMLGGDDGMLGALVLAARAAAIVGAGKVKAETVGNCPSVDWQHPEIMWNKAGGTTAGSCAAVGMGMGLSSRAAVLLRRFLLLPMPLLLDADALTLLAQNDDLRELLRMRRGQTVLTPHPKEAGGLLGCDTREINNDRVGAARRLAAQYSCTVVLKGAGSVVCPPRGDWEICAAGNPQLARGGSGDVLSGIIAALMGILKDVDAAARAGVWLHATAADEGVRENGVFDLNTLARQAAKLMAAN